MTYYIRTSNRELGPFDEKHVRSLLSRNQVSLMDEIRRSDEHSTMPLFQHPDFTDSKNSKFGESEEVDAHLVKVAGALLVSDAVLAEEETTKSTSKKTAPVAKKSPEVKLPKIPDETLRFKTSFWSLQIDGSEHGPYTYLEVLTFLADETIQETIPLKNLKTGWKPLYTHPEFSQDVINKAIKNNPSLSKADIKIRRKNSRFPVDADVTIRKGDKKFRGKAIDLGVGGVGLYVINHGFRIGDLVSVDIPIAKNLSAVILDIRSQFIDAQNFELLRVAIHFEDLQLELVEKLEEFLVKQKIS